MWWFVQALVVFTISTATIDGSQNYCYDDIMDQKSPLREASELLESFLNTSYDDTMPQLQSLVQSFLSPSAEKCLANYDGSQLRVILDSALIGKCILLMNDFKNEEIEQFKTALGSITTDTKPFLDIQDSSYQAACSTVTDHALPCVSKLVPDFVASLKAHSGSCCMDFFNEMDHKIGALDKSIPEIISLLGQALCSRKASETCASTFVHVFLQPSGLQDSIKQLLNGMQVANAEGCAAAEGETFVLTGTYDTTVILGKKEANQILSGCAANLDLLASRIRGLPFAQKNAAMDELFGVKKRSCLPFYKMDLTLEKFLPTKLYGVLASMMQKKCYHIATGFSEKCQFTQVVILPKIPTNDDDDDDAQDGGLTAGARNEPTLSATNACIASIPIMIITVGMVLTLAL